MKILAEISVGELVDKVTILEIKKERLESRAALKNVEAELTALVARLEPILKKNKSLPHLKADLKCINETLWGIEDDIRQKEAAKEFGSDFIQLARAVYFENDKRSKVKREINDLLGSEIVEEKSYSDY